TEDSEKSVAAEVSSRVQLTDNLDLHATLDYEEWQQGVEVGLGFRF
ncbi:MAG TPA: ribonuclease regulator, partial [Vibrio sp.]|nr:ribonuclease regulator [Vibrio sp.]